VLPLGVGCGGSIHPEPTKDPFTVAVPSADAAGTRAAIRAHTHNVDAIVRSDPPPLCVRWQGLIVGCGKVPSLARRIWPAVGVLRLDRWF
jgi:hypothetical protein